MGYFSDTTLILLVAGCAILLVAKMLKVEKLAAKFGLGVILVWLALYLTGYDKTVYHIIFEAPPIQPAKPEDLKYR